MSDLKVRPDGSLSAAVVRQTEDQERRLDKKHNGSAVRHAEYGEPTLSVFC